MLEYCRKVIKFAVHYSINIGAVKLGHSSIKNCTLVNVNSI